MVDMTEELTTHYLDKHNWAGLSIPRLAKRYDCEMNTVRMAMGQIAAENKEMKQPKGNQKKENPQNRCASPKCQSTISWVKTIAGENMCVDPGIKTIIDNNTGEVAKGFTPHWATCKDPDFFRKKKGNKLC